MDSTKKEKEEAAAATEASNHHVELQRERMRLAKLIANIPSENEMKSNLRQLMHEYNEIKDAAQTIIGALANVKCVTLKSLHEEFQLPMK